MMDYTINFAFAIANSSIREIIIQRGFNVSAQIDRYTRGTTADVLPMVNSAATVTFESKEECFAYALQYGPIITLQDLRDSCEAV